MRPTGQEEKETPTRRQVATGGVLGLGALLLVLALLAYHRVPAVERQVGYATVRPAPPRSPSEAARREACRCWMQAEHRVNQELDQLDGWDGRTDGSADREQRWRRLMASDPSGDLRRARAAALRAEALARTADETAEAAELLVRIECDLGEHQRELRQARLVVRLRPQSARAFAILRHGALNNHQGTLARQAHASRNALARLPLPASPGHPDRREGRR